MGAVAAAEADGAGYVLRDDAAHIFLDLDHYRDPATGALADWALRLVEEADSYAEVTPSGRGLRIIGTNESLRAPVHRRIAMPEGGSVEIFHRCPRYVTVSGRLLREAPDALRPICDIAADLLLLAQPASPTTPDASPPRSNPDPLGAPEDIASALRQIPNPDLPWDTWSNIGMAVWRASAGSAAGLAAWTAWSAKSAKHSDAACQERWQHWFRSPPDRIGYASLHRLAREANPLWVKPSLVAALMPGAATQAGGQGASGEWEGDVPHATPSPPSGAQNAPTASLVATPWPEPVNFLHQPLAQTDIGPQHFPEPLLSFAQDTARRMGTSPLAVALSALVACSAVMDDAWQVQPKQHDPTWLEQPRLWAAIVGPPSVLKSPILRATTAPLDHLEAEAAEHHAADLRRHKADLKRWKAEGSDPETVAAG